MDVLGVQVKFKAQIDAKEEEAPAAAVAAPVKVETTPIAVVAEPEAPADEETAEQVAAPESAPVAETKSRNSGMADESARYGESLLREMLGAEPMQDKNGK